MIAVEAAAAGLTARLERGGLSIYGGYDKEPHAGGRWKAGVSWKF